jgi:hypothetical protein
MKRTVLRVAVAAATLALVAPMTGMASAAARVHTQHLTARRLQFVNTSNTTFVETDAVRRGTTRVGYETITCNDGGQQIACSLSLALENGILLGHLTIPISSGSTVHFRGRLTGGLGRFAGDTGTIRGTISGKRSAFTVKYRS